MHQVNTTFSQAMNAGMMITKLKAELLGYSMVWIDPQAMINVQRFGNIAKQHPIQHLQQSDTFQVQLHDCINMFACKHVYNLYILEGCQPQEDSQQTSSSQENVSPISATSHVHTIEENAKILISKGDSPSQCS